MTPSEKLAGLQNLETIYSSIVSYLDNFFHDSRYYLKAEAEAKFFGPDDDGHSSGLVAQTLDGYTVQQIIDAGFPSGGICAWAGSEDSIPAGYYSCNGLNGTPDLRDRTPVVAGSHYSLGSTGGVNTVTTTATVTIASHVLTTSEIPLHSHGPSADYFGGDPTGYPGDYPIGFAGYTVKVDYNHTDYTGSGDPHTHVASFTGTNQVKMPPFMALCLIYKS